MDAAINRTNPPPEMAGARAFGAWHLQPVYALVLILICSFVIEAAIMLALEQVSGLSEWQSTLLDASVLTLILSPILYSLLFLPLRRHIIAQDLHEMHLRALVADLQQAKEQAVVVSQDLAEREAYLRAILDNSLDAIITTDERGLVVGFNPAAERLFGFSREAAMGQAIETLIIPPEWRDRHQKAMLRRAEQMQEGEAFSRRIDVPSQRMDGVRMEVQLSLTLVSTPGRRRFAAFMQDITERKLLMQSLHEALLAAESSSRAKSEFLANMSHEIRTPMNGVLGMVDLALATELPDKVREFLSHAKSSSQLLLRVINDILDYSKIEAGRLEMEEVEFHLGDLLADAINLFRQSAIDKDLELVITASPHALGPLLGDRLRIQQVLVNLVGNAIKFTQKGVIHLKTVVREQGEERVCLEFAVQDTGIGLTEEQMARLFSPFAQADSSVTRKFGGTGLGLTICKRLVEMMNGQIGVSSTPGVGSLFSFTVMLGRVPQGAVYSAKLPDDLQGIKALVVDDNRDARLSVVEMLAHLGLAVTATDSGSQALEAMAAAVGAGAPYALVLVDWQMPGMDGLETVRRMWAELFPEGESARVRPKTILMTPFGREQVVVRAHRIGVDGCLFKPMTPSLLLDTLLDVFGKTVARPYDARQERMDRTTLIRRVGGAQVLLVEDNPINQRVAREMLEGVGIAVTLASHGQEAIQRLLDQPFELVFMDVQMPVMDGYQATRQLRTMTSLQTIPIIAMTAHALAGDRENCLAAGMNDYIAKPIDLQQLCRLLVRWIPPRGHPVPLSLPPAQADGQEAEAWRSLGEVPGIQVRETLERLGVPVAFYRQMLSEFWHTYRSFADSLRRELQRAGDVKSGLRRVHSIKGSAGNLGARALCAAAGALEQAIAGNRRAEWPELLEAFEKELEQILRSLVVLENAVLENAVLENAVPSDCLVVPEGDAEQTAVDWEEVRQQVATMMHWLQKGNVKAIDSLAPLKQLLAGTFFQDELSNLERALDQFAMGKACQHLEEIRKQIPQGGHASG